MAKRAESNGSGRRRGRPRLRRPDALSPRAAVPGPTATGVECENAILDAVKAWQERVAQPDPSDEELEADAGEASGPAGGTEADAEPEPPQEETGRLREEVSRSQRMEKHWRNAYIDERRQAREPDGAPVATEPLQSVREALAQAQEMFPDRLLIKLNSPRE